ncbi:prepilin-type N-terminal cleavage/methylation domain-containing protein [Candidatus Roizmanbacteria bacterium]|nr:prepilin-type N-terminal cleavage/methylation domain-containing protein [Candidatus Roizmanbacteria bacterium]
MDYKKNIAGYSLVEILVSIGVFSIVLFAAISVFSVAQETSRIGYAKTKASQYQRDYIEKVKNIRRDNWEVLESGRYEIIENSGNLFLQATLTGEIIDEYMRYLEIDDAYRDDNGVLVDTPGTLDPSTKKVTVNVSWTGFKPGHIEESLYLTRYLDNLAWIQTSEADFLAGDNQGTVVTNTVDGEVQISPNTKGKWCEPILSSATIDLPGVPNAIWAEPFNIYTSSTNTSYSFMHVEVQNSDPPSGLVIGSFGGYNARAVFGEGNYGYIATTHNSKEIVIIDLNDYTEEGYFNSSGTTNGETIFVHNNRGYMTAGNRLYVFDLSSKTGSRSQIGSYITFANSGDTAGGLYIRQVGGSVYAFISIEGSTVEELKIANLTNHTISSQWRIVGQINIEPNNCSTLESGKSVYVSPDGDRAYISSTNDASFKEFFIIDTSNKTNPTLVGGFSTQPSCTNGGGYEAGGMDPEQSVVVSLDENRVVLVGVDDSADGTNSYEYQILDISNEGSPTMCGSLDVDQGIYGVGAVKEPDGDAYAYLITGDTPQDLKIVQGGPDGIYLENGTFTSQTLDAGHPTVFNRFNVTSLLPSVDTTIRYQVAVVAAGASGNCSDANFSDFNFVGPDGTFSTFFTDDAPIPLDGDGSGYENPGQCLKLRAFLETSDYNQTPSLLDFNVNYVP